MTTLTHYFKTPIAFYNLPHGGCKVVYDCKAVMGEQLIHFRHELTYRVGLNAQIMTHSRVIPLGDEVQA